MWGRSEETVKADFEHQTRQEPFRCALCQLMQPPNSNMYLVSSSATYFAQRETYESLVNGGKSSSRSGACLRCLQKAK